MNAHDKAEARLQRLRDANRLIQIIGEHGRRFFFHAGPSRYLEAGQSRFARLELDRGRVYLIDDYSGARIYTHKTTIINRWRGFSHGGTLRSLVEAMRDYITKGEKISIERIAPTFLDYTKGDLWGYGAEAAETVRRLAAELPIIES